MIKVSGLVAVTVALLLMSLITTLSSVIGSISDLTSPWKVSTTVGLCSAITSKLPRIGPTVFLGSKLARTLVLAPGASTPASSATSVLGQVVWLVLGVMPYYCHL